MLSLTLLNMLFGGTAILLSTWIATVCLRRSTASLRHRIWTLAVVGLLLTPALAAVMPRIHTSPKRQRGVIAVPTVRHPREGGDLENRLDIPLHSTNQELHGLGVQEKVSAEDLGPRLRGDDGERRERDELRSMAKIPWEHVFVGVWLSGVLLGFVSLFLGKLSARNLMRQSVPADESWNDIEEKIAKKLGIRFHVGIRRTDAIAVPLVVGVWKPTVLLPSEAATWTEPQRRSVLIHELSHVLRRDVFWQTLAGLCTAMYWFHPLVHVAVRKMRIEQESACDDAVLLAGETPSDYARLLVDIAGRVLRRTPVHAVAMARPGSVQERVDAILETKRNRKPLGRPAAWGLFVAATVVVSAIFLFSPFGPPPTVKAEPPKAEPPTGKKETPATETTEGYTLDVDGKKYFIPKGKGVLFGLDGVKITHITGITPQPYETDPGKPKMVRVLDDQGNPLEGVVVATSLSGYPSIEQKTDKDGELRFDYAKTEPPNSLFAINVRPNTEQHFVPMYKIWRRTGIVDEIPYETVFRLQKSKTVSGKIVDKEGRPVAGAYVQVVLPRETEFNKAAVLRQLDQLTTDRDGHWKSNHAPADEPSVHITVTHPDYAVESEPILLQKDSPPPRTVLDRMVRVEGFVVDENDKPVPDVDVFTYSIGQPGGNWSGKTDAEGKFIIEKYPPRSSSKNDNTPTIQLFAPDHVRIHQRLFVQEGMKPLRLVMPKGKTLRIRVVDTDKKPLQGINIAAGYVLEKARDFSFERFDFQESLIGPLNDSEKKTNADGLWECRNAPDREVRFRIGDRLERNVLGGDYLTRYVMLKPGDEIQEIVLDRPRMLTGQVIDAKTKKQIQRFTIRDGENQVTEVYLSWVADDPRIIRQLRQILGATLLKDKTLYRIEAEGYEPQVVRFQVEDDTVKLDVELEPEVK